ncbi:MAG: sugar transferase [Candidatus Pacebacteria bacterium]|nr:sugar transferase [Candidatus Paceibacterota bacterium]
MGERTRELSILILGDSIAFFSALWLTLLVRYLSWPAGDLLASHLGPFLLLSGLWLFIFYIGGLYDKHTTILKTFLFSRILNTQVVNIILAFFLFLIIPFGITPKTNLVIYLFISVGLITYWRMYLYPRFAPVAHKRAILLADGEEAIELVDEVNNNDRYSYSFVRLIDSKAAIQTPDFQDKLLALIEKERIDIIVADAHSSYLEKVLPALFDKAFLDFDFTFIDFYKVYEDTFDRVPLSALRYDWFLTHVSQSRSLVYDVLKRLVDIFGSILVGLVFLVLLPIIYVARRSEGAQNIFMTQVRFGQYNRPVKVLKLQTMTYNDTASGTWKHEDAKKGNTVTKVGKILQKMSLDEMPQVWNILKGEMSLIGPRNDIAGLGERLVGEIPYYKIRYFVKPGVTGWAQTNQRYFGSNIQPQSLEESRMRFSYDLYYVKNRSFWLDMAIFLRTIKTVLSRFGVSVYFPRNRAGK